MQKMRAILLVVFSVACAHTQSLKPPIGAFQSSNADQITIAVVGINDFHGSLLPRERKLPNGEIVLSGGAPALFSMIKHLRDEMNGNLLVVDAGDEWQGTLESNSVKGATVVDFFNRLGVKVAAIGNHEFDFNLDNLKKRFHEANYPYVASNIYEKKTKKRVNWPNVHPSVLLEVGGVKFGVIGVSTEQTPSTTRYETVKHLDFVDPSPEVLRESEQLRKAGANAVLATSHAGTECADNPDLRNWGMWDRKALIGACDSDQEIYKLATRVTSATLDGIVAGHTHQVIHHFLAGIPVIEGEAYNQYFNIIYYTFDRKSHALLPELTRIEGLIPICSEFFLGTQHCDARRLALGESPKRIQATFHGAKVENDPEIETWLKPIREGTEKYRKEIIAVTELPLGHFRDKESPFAYLIADVLKEKGRADFALVNSGGIRTSLDAGPITADGLFRALPFDNLLRVVELSGKNVKLLYRIATSGTHGTIGISGLHLEVKAFDLPADRTDLNGDGKLQNWETQRLVSIRTSDGREIEDEKRYRVATFDFILNGGDDFSWFMSRVPTRAISRTFGGYCRDLVSDYLKSVKRINTKENPLVDPKNPRIKFLRDFP